MLNRIHELTKEGVIARIDPERNTELTVQVIHDILDDYRELYDEYLETEVDAQIRTSESSQYPSKKNMLKA